MNDPRCKGCGLPADAPIHTGGHPARCHAFVGRARRLAAIAKWINDNLPEAEAKTEQGYCNTDRKIAGTRLIHPGKGRHGTRIKVFLRKDYINAGMSLTGPRPILDHNAAETYRRNDDVERWLKDYLGCRQGKHGQGYGGECPTCRATTKGESNGRQ